MRKSRCIINVSLVDGKLEKGRYNKLELFIHRNKVSVSSVNVVGAYWNGVRKTSRLWSPLRPSRILVMVCIRSASKFISQRCKAKLAPI